MRRLAPVLLGLLAAPALAAGAPRYRLPFRAGTSHDCTQSAGGKLSHQGDIEHAYDFAMPEGTPVVAAMDGKVITVAVDETKNGSGGKYGAKGNHIEVLHADHTIGVYQHLQANGAKVKPGQQVRQGDPLAASGNTGNSTGPHVHFHVWNNARTASVPVTFADVPEGGVPVKGKTYTSQNVAGIPAATKDRLDACAAGAVEAEAALAPGIALAFCRQATKLKLPAAYPAQEEAKRHQAKLERLPAARAEELEAQAKTEFEAAARALLRLRVGCKGLDEAPLKALERTLAKDPRFAKVKQAERGWCKVQKAFLKALEAELKGKLKRAFAGYRAVAKKRKQAPEVAARAAKRRDALATQLKQRRR